MVPLEQAHTGHESHAADGAFPDTELVA
eukprot:COSAG01_NODE_71640_length_255_cov_0.666667_1_plen_27_part_10